MFKVIRSLSNKSNVCGIMNSLRSKFHIRTFLSQAYYCQEVWEHRLINPVIQKVNLDELFHDLDQRFQRTNQISAVDVDIFANAVTDESYVDELLDLVYKLRLSADSSNSLGSTTHAVVRLLSQFNKNEELLNALDDRLNYGLFLDYYTANILLDDYWKNNEYTLGARVASQLMLQEDYEHPISKSLVLLHCYNYLLKPINWPTLSLPEEPEEEVKIRVKYLRNSYYDDHFDLRDPNKLVGKTLVMFTKGDKDSLSRSLNILGWALYDKKNKVDEILQECKNNLVLYKEVIDLLPKPQNNIDTVTIESVDVVSLLKSNVEKAVLNMSETDIADQCKIFEKWELGRTAALEEQKQRLLVAKRLDNIKDLQASLKEKETKLWFFENEEQIELDIDSKKINYPKRWSGKKNPKKIDEVYVPPELFSKQSNN